MTKSKISTHHALLIIITALLPSYLIRFSIFDIPTNILEFFIVAAFLSGAINSRIRNSWLAAWHKLPRPIIIFASLFLISTIISTAISPHIYTSLGIHKGWIIIPMILGWLIYAAATADNAIIKKIAQALITSGVAVALFGLTQIGSLARIQSIYDVPNSLALFLAPLVVLALFHKIKIGYWNLGYWPAAIMFVALIFTQSLAGVLSVIAVALFSFLVIGKSRLGWSLRIGHWALLTGIVIIAASVFWPKINYLVQPNSSASVRLQLWSISTELIREHPILGIGLGTFEPAYQEKLHEQFARYNSGLTQKAPLSEFIFRDPHNWPLSFWLNTGLLGLISFIALHVYVLVWAFKRWDLIGHWSFGIGVFAALIVLLIIGLVDTIYWKNDLSVLHWIILGLLVSKVNHLSQSRPPEHQQL